MADKVGHNAPQEEIDATPWRFKSQPHLSPADHVRAFQIIYGKTLRPLVGKMPTHTKEKEKSE